MSSWRCAFSTSVRSWYRMGRGGTPRSCFAGSGASSTGTPAAKAPSDSCSHTSGSAGMAHWRPVRLRFTTTLTARVPCSNAA
eukprot:7391875-Prymnesium_polylepis.1